MIFDNVSHGDEVMAVIVSRVRVTFHVRKAEKALYARFYMKMNTKRSLDFIQFASSYSYSYIYYIYIEYAVGT